MLVKDEVMAQPEMLRRSVASIMVADEGLWKALHQNPLQSKSASEERDGVQGAFQKWKLS